MRPRARLQAEADENTCREPLTDLEALDMQQRLLPVFEKMAAAEQAAGQKRGGGDRRSAKAKKKRFPPKKGKAKKDHSKESKRQAAKATGRSAATLEKVAAIKASAKGGSGRLSA